MKRKIIHNRLLFYLEKQKENEILLMKDPKEFAKEQLKLSLLKS